VGELLTNAQSSGAVLTVPVRAVLYGVGVIDVVLAAITLQKVGGLTHFNQAPRNLRSLGR
jgi:hypothetical protein